MNKKKLYIILAIVAVVILTVAVTGILIWNKSKKEADLANRYIDACNLKDEYRYREALEIFEDLDGFEKSDRYVKEIKEIINTPVAQVQVGTYYVAFNSEGEIVSLDSTKKADIPVLEGLQITTAEVGEIIDFGVKDKENILECIRSMDKFGMLDDVTVIDFSDMTNITFNYQSRMDVRCGTHDDFTKKLDVFNEMVGQREPNARGTVDLSKSGKAIYVP